MKKLALVAVCAVCVVAFAVTVNAQAPALNFGAAVNAASFTPAVLPNSGIAQGSIFILFGTNMGPSTLTFAPGFPLPTSLPASTGTSIRIIPAKSTTPVLPFIIYTRADQVAAIMPSTAPLGSGSLTISYNGQTSNSITVNVVDHSFAIFAINQAGSGPGVITNAQTQPSNATNAANPGEQNVIWGTGLGSITSPDDNGPAPGNMPNVPLQLWVGGVQAQVVYQGRSGCCAGLDQINFIVPSGVSGCFVPVYATIAAANGGTVVSNFVTMAIAPTGRTCSNPILGITNSDLQTLSSNGRIRIGYVGLSRTSTSGSGGATANDDKGVAQFWLSSASEFVSSSMNQQPDAYGSCMVYSFLGKNFSDPVRITSFLDAGSAINLSGPNGARILSKYAVGVYTATLGGGTNGQPDYLDPGTYNANNGAGGVDAGAFTATMTNPQPVVWTNESSITTVVRSQGQLVTWTGGDPNGAVLISGSSNMIINPQGALGPGALFICTAKASDGQFKIPAAVLLSLPVPPPGTQSPGFPLAVGSSSGPFPFTAPGLDKGIFLSTAMNTKNVTFQ